MGFLSVSVSGMPVAWQASAARPWLLVECNDLPPDKLRHLRHDGVA